MTAYTQSGLSVIDNYGPPALTPNPVVPGTSVKILGGIRAGDLTTVFLYLAARFDREVEKLDQGGESDDWGYSKRDIRGGSGWSNHAGGAAVDLNALRHGQGRANTFTSDQIHAVGLILNDLQIIEWGARWSGESVDEMHFQLRAGQLDALPIVAAKIRAGQLPNVPAELLSAPPIPGPSPLPTPTDWFAMATEAQLKQIVDAAITATIPKIVTAVMNHQMVKDGSTFIEYVRDSRVDIDSVVKYTGAPDRTVDRNRK